MNDIFGKIIEEGDYLLSPERAYHSTRFRIWKVLEIILDEENRPFMRLETSDNTQKETYSYSGNIYYRLHREDALLYVLQKENK